MTEQNRSGSNVCRLPSQRILSVDALRGLIMILMALDHANMLLSGGSSGEFWSGPLPRFDSALAFWVRSVTHLCAPGFFFLMGVGMVFLQQARLQQQWTSRQITRFFIQRGLLIIAVHFLLSLLFAIPQILQGQFGIVFNVLYILGLSMIAAAWLLDWPAGALLGQAALAFMVPELLLGRVILEGQGVHPLLQILTVPGSMGAHRVYYTFFSWFGLTLLGILFGRWILTDRKQAFRCLPFFSMGALAFFVILRMANGFGNLRPMEGTGWMAFLLLNKYPPSLTFALLTMSVNLLLLYALAQVPSSWLEKKNPLLVFGRSALFFYILHHLVYIALMFAGLNRLPLIRMLPLWVLGVALCYPMCHWYAGFKNRQAPDSLWRMF